MQTHAPRAAGSSRLRVRQHKGKAVRAGSGKTPKNGKAKREAAVDSDNDEFEEVRESQWLGKALRRQKTQEVAATARRSPCVQRPCVQRPRTYPPVCD